MFKDANFLSLLGYACFISGLAMIAKKDIDGVMFFALLSNMNFIGSIIVNSIERNKR